MTSMDKYERESFEVMLYNKAVYDRCLNERDSEYRTTTADIIQWVKDHGHVDNLKDQLKKLNQGRLDYYSIAIDFSIPVIMVKKLSTMDL